MRLLIKGGTVLTLGTRTQNYDNADVLVEEGRISEVGRDLRARGAEVIDATDTIVMPGFVDTHRHAWKTLFRNFGGGGSGERPADPSVYGPHYTPDDVYAATLLALLGAAEAGMTTVADWSDIQVDPSFTEAALSAHADSGMRTVFVPVAPSWVRASPAQPTTPGPLTTLAWGPADHNGIEVDLVREGWQQARQHGQRIHAHVGKRRDQDGLVARMKDEGLLGDDVTLIHCTNLGETDLEAIERTGTRVSITPANEMAAGYGAPPIQALIDRGVRPGLGVGNEIEVPGDIFAQMRAANSIQHATLFDMKLSGKAGIPNLLSTREIIRYGTIDGAHCLGLDDVTGSLTPGKQADILILRADRPNIAPVNDPIGAVVWGMDTSNIDWVLVSGLPLIREGRLTNDIPNVSHLVTAARDRIARVAGLLAPTGAQR